MYFSQCMVYVLVGFVWGQTELVWLNLVVVVVLWLLFYCGFVNGGRLVLKWGRRWTFVGG